MKKYNIDNFPDLTLNQRHRINFSYPYMSTSFKYDEEDDILLQCINKQDFTRNLTISNDSNNEYFFKLKPRSKKTINLRDYFFSCDPFLVFTLDNVPTRVEFCKSKIQLQIKCGQYKPFLVDFESDKIENVWFDDGDEITLTCYNEKRTPSIIFINNFYQFVPKTCVVNYNLKEIVDNDKTVTITLDGAQTKYIFHIRDTFPMIYIQEEDEKSRVINRRSIYCIPDNEILDIYYNPDNKLFLECANDGQSCKSRELVINHDKYIIEKDTIDEFEFYKLDDKPFRIKLNDNIKFVLKLHHLSGN